MRPISFHKAEVIFKSDDEDIEDLPVLPITYEGFGECLLSCWKPSLWDRFRILIGMPVYLSLLSKVQPPCSLGTDRLAIMPKEQWDAELKSSPDTEPERPIKVFVLKKDYPGLSAGARFQQSARNRNIYFCGIPISSQRPEEDQVGLVKLEARYVNDSDWFEQVEDE